MEARRTLVQWLAGCCILRRASDSERGSGASGTSEVVTQGIKNAFAYMDDGPQARDRHGADFVTARESSVNPGYSEQA